MAIFRSKMNYTIVPIRNCLGAVSSGEGLSNLMKLGFGTLCKGVSRIHNLLKSLGMGAPHMGEEGFFKDLDIFHINTITVSLHANEKRGNDFLGLVRLVLSLLEELIKSDTTVKLLLGSRVKIGTELGKGGNLTVLGKLELHCTSNGFGGLVLGSGSDTRHGKTNGNGRALTLVEELGFEENLSISNGNHIGRNVSRHISCLGLDDWKGSERSSSKLPVHLSSTLKKTGVKVKHITGVSLTARGATKKKRHLTVGNGLL
mmetsp:Transcript_18326/g.33226  ORF Transcript_18326/g.33226 Transcript_18326/m.33226 type:complete len:259 (-) Transcript_18326:944-1720(-)